MPGGCPQLSQQGYCCDLEGETVNRGERESSCELAFHSAAGDVNTGSDKQLILLCRLFQGGDNQNYEYVHYYVCCELSSRGRRFLSAGQFIVYGETVQECVKRQFCLNWGAKSWLNVQFANRNLRKKNEKAQPPDDCSCEIVSYLHYVVSSQKLKSWICPIYLWIIPLG